MKLKEEEESKFNIINQITNTEIQKEQANKSLEKFIDLLKYL